MMPANQLFKSWQSNNDRSFYLAFLRVAICLWLLKEIGINLPYLEMMYGANSFVAAPQNQLFVWLHIDVNILRDHYLTIIILYSLFILLNLFGIGKNFSALMVFLFNDVLFRMNIYISNGGVYMCRFILLYLVLADSYQYFVLFKNKTQNSYEKKKLSLFFTNISAYAIMIHLCLAYLVSAIIKIQSPAWRNGEELYYIFSQERYNGTGYNAALAHHTWLVKLLTWFTLVFEFGFPILIWVKKLRLPVIAAGILFHAGIYFMMMIYGFQFIFLLPYGLFFTNQEWFGFFAAIRKKLTKNGS